MKRNCAKTLPEFRAGDTVRVNVRLQEGEGEKTKERLQAFEGVVISKKGRASSATFTVRRVSFGVGIERIFPLHSPTISSIEVVSKGKVRRARLYYLRDPEGQSGGKIRSMPHATTDAAHRKGRTGGPGPSWRSLHPSKGLQAFLGLLAFAFLQAHVDAHGVARAELGEVFAQLRFMEFTNYRIHVPVSF